MVRPIIAMTKSTHPKRGLSRKEVVDVKARNAIMQLAVALYGSMLSMIFIKGMADELFPPAALRRRKK